MSKKETTGKKKGRRALIISIVVLAWLMLMASLTVLADGRTVRFYMSGEQDMSIEQGTDFVDPGVYAVSTGRLFGEGKKPLPITVSGEVDTGTVGSYIIDYRVEYFFSPYSTSRTVHVLDTEAPTIELEYIEGYAPSWIDGYVEEGYRAYDSYDGDLTHQVSCQQFADKIVYTVSDSSGNETSVERPLPDYRDMPLISLNGGEYMELMAGTPYQEPGYSAMDGMGNDLTGHIICEGEAMSISSSMAIWATP